MNAKPIIRVEDVMKPDFDLVDGMHTVAQVLRNSQHPESKCFIVDIRHEDDEYGIVLLSDIAKRVVARNKSPERVNIYEIMSKPVVSVAPKMDIRYCARLFENLGLGVHRWSKPAKWWASSAIPTSYCSACATNCCNGTVSAPLGGSARTLGKSPPQLEPQHRLNFKPLPQGQIWLRAGLQDGVRAANCSPSVYNHCP